MVNLARLGVAHFAMILILFFFASGQIFKSNVQSQNTFHLSRLISDRPRKGDAEGARMLGRVEVRDVDLPIL